MCSLRGGKLIPHIYIRMPINFIKVTFHTFEVVKYKLLFPLLKVNVHIAIHTKCQFKLKMKFTSFQSGFVSNQIHSVLYVCFAFVITVLFSGSHTWELISSSL